MGSKVNPNGLRFGVNKNWYSRWSAKDNAQTAKWLVEDDKIRTYFINQYKTAMIDHIEIERLNANSITIFVYSAQPAIITGNEDTNLVNVAKSINKIVGRNVKVSIKVIAFENPALSARLIAREIADAIENRGSFRNAQKFAIKKVLKAGAKGVKTHVSGRLAGVEMARAEGYSEGIITLSTLRSNIDYALEEAHTTYGIIGVKVWINKGEIFSRKQKRPNSINTSKKPIANNKKPFVKAESTNKRQDNNKNVKREPKDSKQNKNFSKPLNNKKPTSDKPTTITKQPVNKKPSTKKVGE